LIAETEQARDAIISDSNLIAQLTHARNCDLALVSIGPINFDMNLYKLGYIARDDVQALIESRAVGEVLSSFYDQEGRLLETELNHRSIGLEIPDLEKIPTCVAISGGVDKAEAILGALKNGFLDVLITDINTAERVLKIAEKAAVV